MTVLWVVGMGYTSSTNNFQHRLMFI
uniref:Uncharacterized protein n=1 Tax=Anguilla anguilla TaxID=7936 RepID=A0A0E9Q5X6_ANGAN